MGGGGDTDEADGCAAAVALTPFLAVAHFAAASWLSFVLFGLAGGIETDGRLTRYGGIEYAWTCLAWLPGGLLVAAGGPLAAVGASLMLAGSGAAGLSLASLVVRLASGARPRFGQQGWRLWVPLALWLVWVPVPTSARCTPPSSPPSPLALWLVWVPVPTAGTITYWHTVAY